MILISFNQFFDYIISALIGPVFNSSSSRPFYFSGGVIEGYIKLHREILKWEWFNSECMFKLWITLLLLANHKETKWRGEKIAPGQLLTGRKQLGLQTGLGEANIYRLLKVLEKSQQINIKTTNKYTIITIVNWNKYQSNEQQNNNKITTKSQQNNTSKKLRSKEVKNNNICRDAIAILEKFNEVHNRKFKPTEDTLKPIIALLKKRYDMFEIAQTMIYIASQQYFIDNKQYASPETLCRASKFPKYYEQTLREIGFEGD